MIPFVSLRYHGLSPGPSAFAITIPLFQFIFERPVFSVMGKVSWEFLEVTLKLLSCMFSELFSGSWDHSLRDVTTSTVRHVSFFIWPAYTFILWRLQIWASRGPEFNPNLRAPLPTHPWTMSQAKLRPLFSPLDSSQDYLGIWMVPPCHLV